MILGGNKPVQRPASNSDARKRREGTVGLESTDALRGAPRSLPHVSDWTSEALARARLALRERLCGFDDDGERTVRVELLGSLDEIATSVVAAIQGPS